MLRPSLTAVAALAAAVLLAMAEPGHALTRSPTIGTPEQCTIDALAGGADLGCEGARCWCCYSDGCYVCNASGTDCVWDQGAYNQALPGVLDTSGGLTKFQDQPPSTPPVIDLQRPGAR